MSISLTVLVLGGDEAAAAAAARELEAGGFAPTWRMVADEAAFRAAIAEPPDLILAHAAQPPRDARNSLNAHTALDILSEAELGIPLLVVAVPGGAERAAGAGMAGVQPQSSLGRLAEAAGEALGRRQPCAGERRGRAQLQGLTRRLLRAQDDERALVAHALHDEIGQLLVALQLNLRAALAEAPPSRQGRLRDSQALAERLIGEVRTLSRELRPALLDDLGLVPALRWHLERLGERSGLALTLSARPEGLRLPPEIAIACFRIAQEALSNVVRHARAASARVDLRREGGCLRLAISDDGVGFDVEAARLRGAGGASLGLLSMEERALMVGGELELISAPGAGTCVLARVALPLAGAPAGDG